MYCRWYWCNTMATILIWRSLWRFDTSCTDLFIVYFLLRYTHIYFSSKYKYQICECHQKKQPLEDKVILIEAQYKKKSSCHFDIKETQLFAIHFLWEYMIILTNSFISCGMFGLFWIHCQMQSWAIPTSYIVRTCNTNYRYSQNDAKVRG